MEEQRQQLTKTDFIKRLINTATLAGAFDAEQARAGLNCADAIEIQINQLEGKITAFQSELDSANDECKSSAETIMLLEEELRSIELPVKAIKKTAKT